MVNYDFPAPGQGTEVPNVIPMWCWLMPLPSHPYPGELLAPTLPLQSSPF